MSTNFDCTFADGKLGHELQQSVERGLLNLSEETKSLQLQLDVLQNEKRLLESSLEHSISQISSQKSEIEKLLNENKLLQENSVQLSSQVENLMKENVLMNTDKLAAAEEMGRLKLSLTMANEKNICLKSELEKIQDSMKKYTNSVPDVDVANHTPGCQQYETAPENLNLTDSEKKVPEKLSFGHRKHTAKKNVRKTKGTPLKRKKIKQRMQIAKKIVDQENEAPAPLNRQFSELLISPEPVAISDNSPKVDTSQNVSKAMSKSSTEPVNLELLFYSQNHSYSTEYPSQDDYYVQEPLDLNEEDIQFYDFTEHEPNHVGSGLPREDFSFMDGWSVNE